jgi:hypothetical protein
VHPKGHNSNGTSLGLNRNTYRSRLSTRVLLCIVLFRQLTSFGLCTSAFGWGVVLAYLHPITELLVRVVASLNDCMVSCGKISRALRSVTRDRGKGLCWRRHRRVPRLSFYVRSPNIFFKKIEINKNKILTTVGRRHRTLNSNDGHPFLPFHLHALFPPLEDNMYVSPSSSSPSSELTPSSGPTNRPPPRQSPPVPRRSLLPWLPQEVLFPSLQQLDLSSDPLLSALFAIEIAAFTVLRPRFRVIYEPRAFIGPTRCPQNPLLFFSTKY